MRASLVTFSAILAALVLSPGPAVAEAGPIGLSVDGSTFGDQIDDSLFASSLRWVPGDSRTATFFVRNQSGGSADLTLDLLGDHVGDLLDSDDVHVTATAEGGIALAASGGAEARLLALDDVADHEVVKVSVRVDLDFSSPNATQLRSTDLPMLVTLSQSGSAAVAASSLGLGGSGLLPDTGGPAAWLAILAIVCLGGGAALIPRRPTNEGSSHG